MTNSLPYWIQVLQALLTPAIAFLAVVIGVFQWRTTQQKVALDLFNRWLAKYTALRDRCKCKRRPHDRRRAATAYLPQRRLRRPNERIPEARSQKIGGRP
jgi:hypothetical protein